MEVSPRAIDCLFPRGVWATRSHGDAAWRCDRARDDESARLSWPVGDEVQVWLHPTFEARGIVPGPNTDLQTNQRLQVGHCIDGVSDLYRSTGIGRHMPDSTPHQAKPLNQISLHSHTPWIRKSQNTHTRSTSPMTSSAPLPSRMPTSLHSRGRGRTAS